jgi:hypothetical protein
MQDPTLGVAFSGFRNAATIAYRTSDRKATNLLNPEVDFRDKDHHGCFASASLASFFPARRMHLSGEFGSEELSHILSLISISFYGLWGSRDRTTSQAVMSLGWKKNSGFQPALCTELETVVLQC